MIIADGPEGGNELNQLFSAEKMLGLLLIYDQAFFSQDILDLLKSFRSAKYVEFSEKITRVIHRLSVFFFFSDIVEPRRGRMH